ncbi:helix-turn-helix transcriptional regulator [Labilibacter marinus]|uniref:helix-turn-helix transcriptional regulator n=1 Tax=Labilibacter marinus TaxID=1477105 RepID=UPI0009501BDB|nr:YafY family protein [Labilibacter marinus]
MNRIDRLSAILIQLQSKKIVKAQEIADRFEISLRTVYRDIRALEEAGIPIGAEAGVGYFLSSEFHLPPVMFTIEEASAFLLAEKLVGKLSDTKVSNAFESALFKVKSVLKHSEKEHLDKLNNKIAVFNNDPVGGKKENLFLFDIQTALANRQVLEITYTANYNKQCTTRIVEPISLCNYDMKWHLIAYCRLRNDYRDFRLDRLESVNMLDENYDEKGHLSLTEYFDRMAKENSLYTIELKLHESLIEQAGSTKYWFGLTEEIKEGEWIHMTFAHSDIELFAKWLLSMENKVQIISPPELKLIIQKRVEELSRYYLT